MLGADPFLASLRRHRLAAGLIVLQSALTTVVLALALAKAGALREGATRPSGLEEGRLAWLSVRGTQDAAMFARERAALSQVDGLAGVSPINQVPFGAEYWSADLSRAPEDGGGVVRAAMYLGDADLRKQLGLALLEGRDFLPGEVQSTRLRLASHVQLDARLAQQFFPHRSALGATIYLGAQPLHVVGVYAPLQAPYPDGVPSLILPLQYPPASTNTYLLRLRNGRPPPAELIAAALRASAPGRWIGDYRSIAELREAYYRHDRWLATCLLFGVAAWLLCTGVGLANLADLLLQARVRQIGLCRALGASSAQIRWQLRRENLLLAGAGALAGLALLHVLLRAWPWLGSQLGTGGIALQAFSIGLMLLTGQCAMWPITREADAVPLTGGLRHA
jgi:putative ABC transport system permease protein